MKVNEFSAKINIGKGVFFNPKMQSLRSISAAFVKANAPKNAKLIDATSATGIRGIRYALESGIKNQVLIDMNSEAYANSLANVKANGVDAEVANKSFQEFANTREERFDIIDIDPFGSPAPLIYDAFKISKDGTLLMVTATDTAVLHGAHANACIKTYGAVPMHTELCKEAGARILLAFITKNAAQFNFGIEPMMCVSDMHYVRVFARISHGAAEALSSMKSLGIASQCQSCRYFEYNYGICAVRDRCPKCHLEMLAAGQMWLGSMSNSTAVKNTVKAMERIGDANAAKQIQAISKELDIPFFYSVPKITKSLSIGSVSHKRVMQKLEEQGYRVSQTQFWKDSIKTDADYSFVAETVRS